MSSTSKLTALLKDESDDDIHNWWYSKLTTFTISGIQKWRHSKLTAFMINTWKLRNSIYILASSVHNNNDVKTVDWNNNEVDSRNMCFIIV